MPSVPSNVVVKEGSRRSAIHLYATRCSQDVRTCLTAYISIPDALMMNRGYTLVFHGARRTLRYAFWFALPHALQPQQERGAAAHRAPFGQTRLPLSISRLSISPPATSSEAEALVRWTDEYKNVVSPEVFVKIAEEKGSSTRSRNSSFVTRSVTSARRFARVQPSAST